MEMRKRGLSLLMLLLALCTCSTSPYATAEMVISHRAPETDSDTRPDYEVALLRLALEKTLDEYGPFRLQAVPRINFIRSIFSIRNNIFPNFFYSLGYEESYLQYPEMTYVRFPIDLGLLGYRTCFIPKTIESKVAQITSMDELKQLSIGQGRGWVDSEILKRNGFKVVELDQYDTLFKMVAAHRFDLFCRGATEVEEEYQRWQHYPNFGYDQHLLIYYPLPLFFYTNSSNTQAIERVTKGLLKAYADGSLQKLWAQKHQQSVNFAQLDKRQVFRLNNPLLKSIDTSYEQYIYKTTQEMNNHSRADNSLSPETPRQ